MSYLYRSIEASEKVQERIDTLKTANGRMTKLAKKHLPENATLKMTGWNDSSFEVMVQNEKREVISAIVKKSEEKDFPFSVKARGSKDGNHYAVLFYLY